MLFGSTGGAAAVGLVDCGASALVPSIVNGGCTGTKAVDGRSVRGFDGGREERRGPVRTVAVLAGRRRSDRAIAGGERIRERVQERGQGGGDGVGRCVGTRRRNGGGRRAGLVRRRRREQRGRDGRKRRERGRSRPGRGRVGCRRARHRSDGCRGEPRSSWSERSARAKIRPIRVSPFEPRAGASAIATVLPSPGIAVSDSRTR